LKFRYIISISGALAILNMVPMFFVDGEWICKGTLLLLFPHLSAAQHKNTNKYILIFGSLLFVVNVIVAAINTFK